MMGWKPIRKLKVSTYHENKASVTNETLQKAPKTDQYLSVFINWSRLPLFNALKEQYEGYRQPIATLW